MGEASIKPKVSIIISNFNGKELLSNCLKAIFKLNYTNFEVIVVDAGSTDGAPEMVIEELPQVNIIKKGRIGIGEAINIGISQATGEIIVFDLNNDDFVTQNWLSPLVNTLMSAPDIGIVNGKRYLGNTGKLDSAGSKIVFGITLGRGHGKTDNNKYNKPTDVDYVSVLAVKREVIEIVGLVDETFFIYGEDPDYCLRARKAGYRILYVPESIFYHQHSSTIGEKTAKRLHYLIRSRIRLIIKHYPLYQKIPLLLLHFTIIPLVYIIYYTYCTRGGFFSYIRAYINALHWNLYNTNIR